MKKTITDSVVTVATHSIITFEPASHSFSGRLSVLSISTEAIINNYENFCDLSVDDYELIVGDSWDIGSEVFLHDSDRIGEAQDRASYTDLVLGDRLFVQ